MNPTSDRGGPPVLLRGFSWRGAGPTPAAVNVETQTHTKSKSKQGGQRHGAVYRHSDSCRTPRRDSADDPELVPGLETVPMAAGRAKNSGIRRSGGGARGGQDIGALALASGRTEHGRGEGGYPKLLGRAEKRKISAYILTGFFHYVLTAGTGWNARCQRRAGGPKAHPLDCRSAQPNSNFLTIGGRKDEKT